MKKIFIECINQLVEFDSNIKTVKFTNTSNYRNLSLDLTNQITVSENDSIVDITKNVLIIYNLYEINLNDKKFLNALYKELEHSINDEEKIMIQKLENIGFDLFDNLQLKTSLPFEYQEEVDISKVFTAFNIAFPKIDYQNYLELITNYFKIATVYLKTKFVISFGLLNLLTNDEIEILNKELSYVNLVLLDISYFPENNNEKLKNDYVISDDWCII